MGFLFEIWGAGVLSRTIRLSASCLEKAKGWLHNALTANSVTALWHKWRAQDHPIAKGENDTYDVALFGSVLNYVQDYSEIFEKFCKISHCIIVDRTSFTNEKVIKIQKIKNFPYTSSYPHITFSRKELEQILTNNNFKIIFEWPSISIMSAPFKFEGFMAVKNDWNELIS